MAKYIFRAALALLVIAGVTVTVVTVSLSQSGQPLFGLLTSVGVSEDVVPSAFRRLVAAEPESDAARRRSRDRATPVRVGRIRREAVPVSLSFSGRLLARREVELRARVSGYVDDVSFTQGDLVERGDVLFRIDPRTFEARVSQLEASLKGAEASLAFLEREVQRIENLEERQFAETSRLDELKSQKQEADASVGQLQAELRAARLDLEFATIEAPFAGKIGFSEVDEGDLVRAGQTLLTRLVDYHPIEVEFQPSAEQLSRIKSRSAEQNRPLRITVSVDGQKAGFSGRITAFGPAARGTTNTVPVRGELANRDQGLVPGQFVRVKVDLGTQPQLLAPTQALVTRQDRRAVYVVSKAGKADVVPVEIGQRVGESVVVTGNLGAGDRVITGNLQTIRPGMSVSVIHEQGGAPVEDKRGDAAKGRTN